MKTQLRIFSSRIFSAGLVVCLLLVVAQQSHGQDPRADVEARKQAKADATAKFLDRDAPKADRLKAVEKLGYPDERTMSALLELAGNPEEDDEIRWEAIRRHRYDEKYITAALAILSDAKNGGEKLNADIVSDISRRTVFVPTAQIRQQIQEVLRKLLDDPRDSVRLNAYRALVPSDDPVAVKRLSDSLKNAEEVPVPLADAIDLLDLAGSVNHIAVLRPFLEHKDPKVQAQAAKALSVDPESRPRIVELVKNRETPPEVRLLGVRALAREDEGFADYAIPLLQNPREDIKLRTAAMSAFSGRLNYQKVAPQDQVRFAKAVEDLATDKSAVTDEAAEARKAAAKLLPYLKRAFPAIKQHYENR